MDIWHIIPTTNFGGVEVNARSLINDFPIKAKHTIFSMSNINGMMLEDLKLLADIKKLFNQKNIMTIPRTIRLFKKNKPDVIIIHTLNSSLLTFITFAKIFRITKIIILVGNPPFKELLFTAA